MFWDDLHDAWKEKGKQAINAMIADKPGDFVKVVASQMPKDFLLQAGSDVNDMSDGELGDIISALRDWVRSVGPDAARERIIEATSDTEVGE
jgi:hypothetical protein